MELKQAYETVMNGILNMALATSVEGQPNVRVVTFTMDDKTPGVLYFTTFKGNRKIKEFEQNPNVALTPLPEGPDTPAQVRIFGKVAPAGRPLEEVAALLVKKAPFFAETLEQGRDALVVYEVRFDEAAVTLGMEDAQMLKI